MPMHLDFRKGQKVLVIFNNGQKMVDRFVERKSKALVLEDSGRIALGDIRATSIYKPKPRNN